MRSSISYEVMKESFDVVTKKYNTTVISRDAMITITCKTKEGVESHFDNLDTYITSNSSYTFSSCPSIEEIKKGTWQYTDSINVSDKDEYNEIKDLYLEWKRRIKC